MHPTTQSTLMAECEYNSNVKHTCVQWFNSRQVIHYLYNYSYILLPASRCRPLGIPFYVGLVAPAALIYLLIWVLFITVLYTYCRRRGGGRDSISFPLAGNITITLMTAIVSSLFFAFGWGVGLAITGSIVIAPVVMLTLTILFIIFTALQGIILLLLNCLGAKEHHKWYQCFCPGEKEGDLTPILPASNRPSSPAASSSSSSSPLPDSKKVPPPPVITVSRTTSKGSLTIISTPAPSGKEKEGKRRGMQIAKATKEEQVPEREFLLREEEDDTI